MSATKQLPRFIAVGAAAAFVHWAMFTFLVKIGVSPLIANPGGFAAGFVVSYLGQRNLTFSASDIPHSTALPRYFFLAVCNFAANELLLALFIRFTPLLPQVSLAIVLVIVAAGTFIFSRNWAFARRH